MTGDPRTETALCELLIAPFTTCGESVFEDSERCVTHYVRLLEDLARGMSHDLTEARAALGALSPSPAEEAVKRVEALLDPEAGMGWPYHGERLFREKDIRAALAAAPHGEG